MRKRWLSGRALGLHVLLAVVVPACLLAGWWQVHRALSGNLLSYLYSVEWPIFAVIAIVGWWQLVHDVPLEGEEGARRPPALKFLLRDNEELPAQQLVWDPALETPELQAYNEYLGSLARRGKRKSWANPRGLPAAVGNEAGAPPR